MSPIDIDQSRIGRGQKPYIIAEAGTNFRDDLPLAEAFIDEAAAAGADAIKFQTHLPDDEMVESAMREMGYGDLFDRMGQYSMTGEQHQTLMEHCAERGITFLSTPFSAEAVDLLISIDVPAIKIGSGELTNYHLLKTAARSGKPLLVSTGMSDYETVRRAGEFLAEHAESFAFLYCISEYPTDRSRFDFGIIQDMKEEFDVPIGFSDHSPGTVAAMAAIGRGADFVEKHFTIDRRLPGGDQDVSIEPEELDRLVAFTETFHRTRGHTKDVSAEEQSVKKWARHSVVAKESIEAGATLTEAVLTTKRPGTGIPASRYYDVIGKSATRDLVENEILQDDDVSP